MSPDQPEELTTGALGVNLNYRWVFSIDWIVDSGLQSKLSFDDVDVNQAVVDAIAAQYVTTKGHPDTGRAMRASATARAIYLRKIFVFKDAEAWQGGSIQLTWSSTELECIPTVGLVIALAVLLTFSVHQRENPGRLEWQFNKAICQHLIWKHISRRRPVYSQPPRVPLIIPGLDFGLLNFGMQKAWRSSMGLSLERDVWRYSLTGFFSRMTNLSLDWGMVDETGEIPIAVEGRAYGVELLFAD